MGLEDDAPAIGIDLGTTYSCVAVYKPGKYGKEGKVEIIANEQGNRTTPSCVAFTETGRLIGEAAKFQEGINPTNSIFDAKRLIGRKFDDSVVQADMNYWPFEVVSVDGKPHIEVTYRKEKKKFLPEEISSMVLVKMKETAEAYLEKPVKNAVITVPAYFNDSQRQATKDAGTISGMNVLRIINEPTAAAIAYGFDKMDKGALNVLIFDLGGGTFDVSILYINKGVLEVKATRGNTHLGGGDFDNRLVKHFIEEINRKSHIDLRSNKKVLSRLRTACERAKRTLSTRTETSIEIYGLFDDTDFHTSITRARFEEINADLFKSTLDIVEKAMSDAKMTKADINEIVLVGGSTRIPMVQELLRDFFNGKELNKSINPDEAVAYGAAVQAAILDGDTSEEFKNLVIHDVTPLSLGTNVIGGIMSFVIERNTVIPARQTKTFITIKDNQSSIRFEVCQGERSLVKDNLLLGEFTLNGITPELRGVEKYDVTFDIDANGILTVTAVERSTKNENKIQITNGNGRLSKQDIERLINDAEKYHLADQQEKERIEAKNSLEFCCYTNKSTANDQSDKGKIGSNDRTMILSNCSETMKWLDDNPQASQQEYKLRETNLNNVCNSIINSSIHTPTYNFS